MKIWILLLSLLAVAGSWWWHTRQNSGSRPPLLRQLHNFLKSILIGVGVYFALVLLAAAYLIISTY
jgi:hypothetical protein